MRESVEPWTDNTKLCGAMRPHNRESKQEIEVEDKYPKKKIGPGYMEYTVESRGEEIFDTVINIAAAIAIGSLPFIIFYLLVAGE